MSDYGMTATGAIDPTKGGAGAHTHHIALTNVKITWNMTGCPPYATSPPKMGFQLNGTVSLMTGNGNIAPFETNPPSSTLQVCVTGGDVVKYSVPIANITLVFGGPATMHFGQQAIHGVVHLVGRSIGRSMNDEGDDCMGTVPSRSVLFVGSPTLFRRIEGECIAQADFGSLQDCSCTH